MKDKPKNKIIYDQIFDNMDLIDQAVKDEIEVASADYIKEIEVSTGEVIKK